MTQNPRLVGVYLVAVLVGGCTAAPSSTPADHYQRGVLLFQANKKEEALDQLNKAIALDPTSTKFYFTRGRIRFDLEDGDGALADFSEVIRRDPNHAEAYAHRAMVWFLKGQKEEAMKDTTQFYKLRPSLKPDLDKFRPKPKREFKIDPETESPS